MDLVVTTGGTGVGPRDVTPEATRTGHRKGAAGVLGGHEDGELRDHALRPDIAGCLRHRGQSIVINLPGSPKAAAECLSFIEAAIPHALEKVKGDPTDCAR